MHQKQKLSNHVLKNVIHVTEKVMELTTIAKHVNLVIYLIQIMKTQQIVFQSPIVYII